MSLLPEEIGRRFLELCRMTDRMLASMSPPDRDRMLQSHLAAARGPQRNFQLLCRMTDALAPMRKALIEKRGQDG